MLRTLFRTIALAAVLLSNTRAIASPELTIASLTPAREETRIGLPNGFQYPNGIARASNGTLYVGSVTSGKILQVRPNGRIETLFPGSHEIFAANSLRLDEQRGILWGASSDFLGVRGADGKVTRRPHRIFALDIRTGKVLRVILMPDGGFGNDMAIDPTGGVYLTDSNRPRIHYLAPGAKQLQVWAEDERLRSQPIGLAGIARATNGIVVVGLFSGGRLFKVTPSPQGKPQVAAISLQRSIENPDGMVFAPDGSLLVLEGAIASGNGRLLRIRDILAPASKPKAIEVLADKMESPVNLTVAGRQIWVTESRIRHRLIPGKEAAVPDRFFIRHFTLPSSKTTKTSWLRFDPP
ncbi:gluconolaconase [Scytonema millei]|uniref:Gluconolaconase n=1 Tax=Scytonema millei VB511283 TaxID=1245923 RepID=A0A9X5I5S4_9CYAN|nr:gluconolaconase [Scytonema millei]NHC35792.1 gluconolaconase [Scytonema millei VB511283]